MAKKRIVVVCPGRGSYTADTLNYLKKYKDLYSDFIHEIDAYREQWGEPSISELDSKEKFSPSLHTRGEHASALIYTCALCDFASISKDEYDVVAVVGNSMGWYLSLACAGSLDNAGAFQVVQTMGSMMKEQIIGAQIIYPVVNDDWLPDPDRQMLVQQMISDVSSKGLGQAYISIWLGGYVVIAGDRPGIDHLLKNLPKNGDYPFQLINHAAFHTPMLYETSSRAFDVLPEELFKAPQIPLIDGQGKIWMPYSCDVKSLYEYTLGKQVYAPYDFTKSLTVALKEFMPDAIWLLGPGASLGGVIGQVLVSLNWRGIRNKNDFKIKSEEILLTSGGKR